MPVKVFVLIDKMNWSYHSIAKSIIKYNSDDDVKMDICAIKGNESYIRKEQGKYDLFFVMGFQNYDRIDFLPQKRTIVGVHSCHSWDNKQTMPGIVIRPDNLTIDYLNKFLRVNTVSKYLFNLFHHGGVENIFLTLNGVDSKVFVPDHKKRGHSDFVVGYSGTKSHDWRKGISDFVIPSSDRAGATIKLAMREDGSSVDMSGMPEFYNSLDCYICASSSEGFSLSVLEAASCGLPIISTKVSGCVELIKDGENGFLVDRNIMDISGKIRFLMDNRDFSNEMGRRMRKTIEEEFCWSKRYRSWINFIRGV